MAAQLYIIGTDHRFQCGVPNCRPEEAEQFAAKLRSLCKAYKIRRIAEEMTAYGRRRYQVSETMVQKVAREMKLFHHDTDLSLAARHALAVTDDTVLRASRALPVKDAGEKISNALDDLRNELRRRVWVARILRGSPWPVLVVIGANHVQPFRRLWRKFGVNVKILHEDWGPNEGRSESTSEQEHNPRSVLR